MNIYAIRHKETKQLATFDEMHCFKSVASAADAYNRGTRKWIHTDKKPRKDNGWEWRQRHFVDQDEYEIVEITPFVETSEIVCKATKVRKVKIVEFEVSLK